MAKNLDGNEVGVIIEADSLLTQIARARNVKKAAPKAAPKPVAKAAPKAAPKAAVKKA